MRIWRWKIWPISWGEMGIDDGRWSGRFFMSWNLKTWIPNGSHVDMYWMFWCLPLDSNILHEYPIGIRFLDDLELPEVIRLEVMSAWLTKSAWMEYDQLMSFLHGNCAPDIEFYNWWRWCTCLALETSNSWTWCRLHHQKSIKILDRKRMAEDLWKLEDWESSIAMEDLPVHPFLWLTFPWTVFSAGVEEHPYFTVWHDCLNLLWTSFEGRTRWWIPNPPLFLDVLG